MNSLGTILANISWYLPKSWRVALDRLAMRGTLYYFRKEHEDCIYTLKRLGDEYSLSLCFRLLHDGAPCKLTYIGEPLEIASIVIEEADPYWAPAWRDR